jgi:FKBP-type peptidyl-prolyl cis-trans isomerase
VDVTQKIADSVLFSSETIGEPFEVLIEEPSFVGDFMCALMSMHLNDHASLVFSLDSMFLSIGEQVPDIVESGTMTEMDIVLKEIVKKEVLEEELRNELISRKNEEVLMLETYYNDDKCIITEDSLIVLNINKGNGKFAKAGNIMKVYFTFNTLEGDTLLDFMTGEPYELVFGDMALGQGFYEALSLVGKGGKAEFIIPSSLAFGSEGLQDAILPYTPFGLKLEVIDIMTSDEYEAEQKAIKEKEEAANAKRLNEEPKRIAKYIKDNNIMEKPQPSGLYYIEKQAGDGDSVQDGDLVAVHYSIYNLDNQLIESSYDYGQPLPFVYGGDQMIAGIEEAVGYMRVGGKARIIVPSRLGFGDVTIDESLPANTPLVIDLEFVDLQR